MSITVFSTEEQARSSLQYILDKNEPVHDEIIGKACDAVSSYEKTYYPFPRQGYTQKGIPIISPYSKIPQTEIDAVVKDLGKGKELTALVCLYVIEEGPKKEYHFYEGKVVVCEYDTGLQSKDGEGYRNLSDLIDAVTIRLTGEADSLHGATITPLFYTIQKEKSQSKEEGIKMFTGLVERFSELVPFSPELQTGKEDLLKLIPHVVSDYCHRGLNKKEISEFEMLSSQT